MELPEAVMDEIEKLSEEGNQLFDEDEFSDAIVKWNKALQMVPDPKKDWEAYVWLNASIGDAYYHDGEFRMAKDAFLEALNGPDGHSNAFIQYRLGQCEYRLDNAGRATEYLLRAYMLDGAAIFEAEEGGDEFYRVLLSKGLVPARSAN